MINNDNSSHLEFKVTFPHWVLTSNSLILSRAGCMFMHASANHCLPPLLGVPLFVAQLQPSPETCACLATETCFPTMLTMITPGGTLGCLFWPSCSERKEGKLQLCVVDELLVESIKPVKMKVGKSGSLATLLVGDANLKSF